MRVFPSKHKTIRFYRRYFFSFVELYDNLFFPFLPFIRHHKTKKELSRDNPFTFIQKHYEIYVANKIILIDNGN